MFEECKAIEANELSGRLRIVTGRTRAGAPRVRAAAALADHAHLYLVAYETTGADLEPLLSLVATIRPLRSSPVISRHLWSVE